MNYKAVDGKHYDVFVERSVYLVNGRIKLILYSTDTQYPFAIASLNVPDELEEDEVVIKDFDECQGMLEFLINNKIIAPTHRSVKAGNIYAPVCKILI